jgi:lantibiotic modifying enzyme
MARLAALDVLDDSDLRSEIEVAVATTARHPLGGPDHLCCGNLGRIDVTLTAGCRLERRSLLETAWSQAKMVLRRAAFHGEFCLPDTVDGSRRVHPGLFHGVAGIGYELLRLAAPSRHASLLTFAGEAW